MELEPLGDSRDTSTYIRQVTAMRASPGVTWQEIVAEYYEKINQPDSAMSTVTFIEYRYILSLSICGFTSHIEHGNEYGTSTPMSIAKDLIAQRDYENAGGFLGPKINGRSASPRDFIPKD